MTSDHLGSAIARTPLFAGAGAVSAWVCGPHGDRRSRGTRAPGEYYWGGAAGT
jgi:hypothetical protein